MRCLGFNDVSVESDTPVRNGDRGFVTVDRPGRSRFTGQQGGGPFFADSVGPEDEVSGINSTDEWVASVSLKFFANQRHELSSESIHPTAVAPFGAASDVLSLRRS